jgi:hypothetical protein
MHSLKGWHDVNPNGTRFLLSSSYFFILKYFLFIPVLYQLVEEANQRAAEAAILQKLADKARQDAARSLRRTCAVALHVREKLPVGHREELSRDNQRISNWLLGADLSFLESLTDEEPVSLEDLSSILGLLSTLPRAPSASGPSRLYEPPVSPSKRLSPTKPRAPLNSPFKPAIGPFSLPLPRETIFATLDQVEDTDAEGVPDPEVVSGTEGEDGMAVDQLLDGRASSEV